MRKLLLIISIGFVFIYGIAIGHYKLFPFDILYLVKNKVHKENNKSPLYEVFTEEVSNEELIYPSLLNLNDVYIYNKKILIPKGLYSQAYKNIKLGQIEEINMASNIEILKINFLLDKKKYSAFAYGKKIKQCENQNNSTALIIPGSGHNQSFKIYKNDPSNYHYGYHEALKEGGVDNILIQIKPNNDARAWHNGFGKKVSDNFIFSWQIRMGGSFSISYLIEAMAIVKYIQSCKNKSVVMGLSQGGEAALYVALQASPTYAIISSGYSLQGEYWIPAGFDQLLGIPDSEKIAKKEKFINFISNSPTNYFFSWGDNEGLYYGTDAKNQFTKEILDTIDNATGIIHSKGHRFPVTEIQNFLKKIR